MERPTDDAQILEVRERQKRNFLATLLCSQGVPMICGGDEISRTQMGNNNAYAQDNEITWLDWNLDDRKKELLASHGHYWRLVFDTRESTTECKDMACGAAHSMIARSAALFVEVVDPEGGGPALLSAAPAMREPEPESPAPPEQQPEQPPTPEPEPEMPARPEPQPEAPKPPEPEPEAPIKTRRRRPKKETAPV